MRGKYIEMEIFEKISKKLTALILISYNYIINTICKDQKQKWDFPKNQINLITDKNNNLR